MSEKRRRLIIATHIILPLVLAIAAYFLVEHYQFIAFLLLTLIWEALYLRGLKFKNRIFHSHVSLTIFTFMWMWITHLAWLVLVIALFYVLWELTRTKTTARV